MWLNVSCWLTAGQQACDPRTGDGRIPTAFIAAASRKGLINPLKFNGNYMYRLILSVSNAVLCIYEFHMILSVNTDYFINHHQTNW
jgi:hypothetical protein